MPNNSVRDFIEAKENTRKIGNLKEDLVVLMQSMIERKDTDRPKLE